MIHPNLSGRQVLEIMSRQVGTHFDPAVYEAYLRSRPAFREICDRLADRAAA